MTTPTAASALDPGRLAGHLRLVRGSVAAGLLVMLLFSAPWTWGSNPVVVFLLLLLSLPALLVLWRLRRAPYRDGLAYAGVVGVASAACAGMALAVGQASSWLDTAEAVLFLATQGVQAVSAAVTSWRLRGTEQPAPKPGPPPVLEVPEGDRSAVGKALRIVRGGAAGFLLLAAVPAYFMAATLGPVFAGLLLLSVCMPHLTVLARLRSGPRQDGLDLARVLGILLGAGAGILGLWSVGNWPREWPFTVWFGAALLLHGALAGGAYMVPRRLEPLPEAAPRSTRKALSPLGWFVVTFVLAAMIPSVVSIQGRGTRTAMRAWLAQVRSCAEDYAASHPTGYPARLDLLGPQGTRCLQVLAPNGVDSRIAYAPAAAEPGGRVPGYTLTLRPSHPGLPGHRHYFLDASGAIRWTEEDRDAGPGDPKLE